MKFKTFCRDNIKKINYMDGTILYYKKELNIIIKVLPFY